MTVTLNLTDQRDTLKMLRETLCRAQTGIGVTYPNETRDADLARLGRLITEIDRQRPLGVDGKHGDETFFDRLHRIASEIDLAEHFGIVVQKDLGVVEGGRYYYQIRCYRRDAITGEMGYGFGGKAYLSEHATDSELVQTIFGLYKSYWEHEARETFQWRGRRVFGPHISTEALWDVARRVDVRSAKHVEDQA